MPLRVRVSCQWDPTPHHLESTTKDYISCPYDDRTLVNIFNKLYSYARTLTYPPRRPRLRITRFSPYEADDIEMLTSSPSPTLHASTASGASPRASLYSRSSHNGSYRYSTSSSPRPYIRRPPAAAFPGRSSPTIATSRTSLSTSTRSSKTTVDAGTQYTPPLNPAKKTSPSASSLGKRRNSSTPPSMSPAIPPEPALAPQLPQKPITAAPPPPTSHPTSTPTIPKTKPTTSDSPVTSSSSTSASASTSTTSAAKRARHSPSTQKPLPADYSTCDTTSLCTIISNMLLELIRLNDDIPLRDGGLTRFHSRAPPGISVADYLQRLTTHATLSPPILLSMVYYIDRLCALYPAFTISSLTVHRFLITAATVASKGLSDSFWTNSLYARVGGVSLKELALLELEFLWRVEWRIVPRPEVLVDYYRSLVERSEGFRIVGEGERKKRSRRRKDTQGSGSSEGSLSSGAGGSSGEPMQVEEGSEKGKGEEKVG
ncbi:nuc-1 negative regulatory protein preg [Physcia stellaris]|nr:nuc-1 negative regulatory protein preg [Physcia stellaris]